MNTSFDGRICVMRKYLLFFKLSIQEYFEYRVNMLVIVLSGFVPFFATLFLWRAIYDAGGSVGNYTLADLAVYTVLSVSLRLITSMEAHFSVADDVRKGNLSNYLIKPMNYFWARFFRRLGLIPIRIIGSLVLGALFLLVLGEEISINLRVDGVIFFLLFSLLSVFLNYALSFLYGCIAFWLKEILGVYVSIWFTVKFLSGTFFPLDLLGGLFKNIVLALPFQLGVYVPIIALLGKYEMVDYLKLSGLYVFWTFVVFLLVGFVWKKAQNHYESVGI
ncbi:ABC-2 family transporter protein [Candidatus Dojkabacteria bacterium]|nr:ABC-2 family transporter protein [Candidatus Dojkabacteria bacterium]